MVRFTETLFFALVLSCSTQAAKKQCRQERLVPEETIQRFSTALRTGDNDTIEQLFSNRERARALLSSKFTDGKVSHSPLQHISSLPLECAFLMEKAKQMDFLNRILSAVDSQGIGILPYAILPHNKHQDRKRYRCNEGLANWICFLLQSANKKTQKQMLSPKHWPDKQKPHEWVAKKFIPSPERRMLIWKLCNQLQRMRK